MTSRLLTFAFALLLVAGAAQVLPVRAESAPPTAAAGDPVAELTRVMQLPAMLEVLRLEGMDYANSLDADLFGGSGGADWRAAVERVHDPVRMSERFGAALSAALADDPATVAAAISFFGDARGQNLLAREVEARRALLDEAVEDAAKARLAAMAADRDPRLTLLHRFAEANDLVEMNVQGAMNANLAFYRGLRDAGGPGTEDLAEDRMLADVWSQEPEVRRETEEWLYPFLALAYAGVPDGDLEAYTAFSLTPEGRRLNAALFAAFDAVFNAQAYDLGLETGRQLAGQDI